MLPYLSVKRRYYPTYLQRSPISEDIVGIINADILLEAGDWTSVIGAAVQKAIAVAHRYDVKSYEDQRSGTFYFLDTMSSFLSVSNSRKNRPALRTRYAFVG